MEDLIWLIILWQSLLNSESDPLCFQLRNINMWSLVFQINSIKRTSFSKKKKYNICNIIIIVMIIPTNLITKIWRKCAKPHSITRGHHHSEREKSDLPRKWRKYLRRSRWNRCAEVQIILPCVWLQPRAF